MSTLNQPGEPDVYKNGPILPIQSEEIDMEAVIAEANSDKAEESAARKDEQDEIAAIKAGLKGNPDAQQETQSAEVIELNKSKKTFKYAESFLNPDTSETIELVETPLKKLKELAHNHSPRMTRRVEALSMDYIDPLIKVMYETFEISQSLNTELKAAKKLTPQLIESIAIGLEKIIDLTFKFKKVADLGAIDDLQTKIKIELEEDVERGFTDFDTAKEIINNFDLLINVISAIAKKDTHGLEARLTKIHTLNTPSTSPTPTS